MFIAKQKSISSTIRALRLAAEAFKKGAGVKAATKKAKGSVKKAADNVTGAAQP
jgi:hypothetical protein